MGHINKGWVVVEEGIQKLGDGNPLPRGRGPTSTRVEEHYAKKPASQNWYSTAEVFYGNEAPDGPEMDAMWDEMRTMRVKLNQMASSARPEAQPTYMATTPVQQNYAPPAQQNYVAQSVVQPAYMAQTQTQASQSSGMDDQAFNANFAKAMRNFMNANSGGNMEQYVTTRGGRETGTQAGQGF